MQVNSTADSLHTWQIAGLRDWEEAVQWCSWKQGKQSLRAVLEQEQDK